MRTTLDINEQLLNRVLRLSKAKSKKEALHISMEAYIRQKRLESLTERLGSGAVSMTQKQLEQMRD